MHDRRLGTALRLGMLLGFAWMVRELIPPVALGGLFALLLARVHGWMRRRLGRAARLAPAVVTATTLVLIVLPAVAIATRLVLAVDELAEGGWGQTVDRIEVFLAESLGTLRASVGFSLPQLRAGLDDLIRQFGGAIANVAGDLATALPGQILMLFLFVVSLYLFLRDGQRLYEWLLELSPFPREHTSDLFRSIHETVNAAILGAGASALVQGALMIAALYLFGIPGAFLFGVVASVLALIPVVGTTPVSLGAVIYLIAVDRSGAAIGMAIAGLAVGAADNIVRPWVQGSQATRLHPLFVLLGIFGGLQAFGPTGIILGPVLAALATWALVDYRRVHQRAAANSEPAERAPAVRELPAVADRRP